MMGIKYQLRKTLDVAPAGLYKSSIHFCIQAANRVKTCWL